MISHRQDLFAWSNVERIQIKYFEPRADEPLTHTKHTFTLNKDTTHKHLVFF